MATDNVGTPASRTEYRFSTGNSSHTEQASAGKTLGGTACSTTWTDAPSLEGRVIGVLSGHNQTGTAADLIHEEWRLWSWVTPPGLPASIKAPQLPSTRSLDKDNFVTGQKLTATTTTFDSLGNPLLRSSLGETVPISSPTCALDEAYLNDEVRVQATWATNLPEWIFTPSVVKACADSGCATILRQNEIYYDGSSSLGVVSVGDVTKTRT